MNREIHELFWFLQFNYTVKQLINYTVKQLNYIYN